MSSTNKRPNILLIMCDQLRWCEVGCYGNPSIKTPNIDRLAADGARFETACTNSPLCGPSRSVTLSGQYCRTCKGTLGGLGEATSPRTQLPDPTLPEVLKAAGYRTAVIGSWNVQPKPDLIGFDFAVYPDFAPSYNGRKYHINSDEKTFVDGWTWEYEAKVAADYLQAAGDDPFFLYFNLEPPHMPLMHAPLEDRTRYSCDDIVLRPNVVIDGKLPYDEEWFRIYLWEQHVAGADAADTRPPIPENFDLLDLMVLYYGMVGVVDRQVGALMDALEATGHANDTIVAFVSDHGDNLGSHHWFNKCRPTDESIRIPMIVRDGRLAPSPVTVTGVASLVDLAPTLLGLAGLGKLNHFTGADFSPVIWGEPERAAEGCAYIECVNGVENDELVSVIAIRTSRYLYGMRLSGNAAYSHDSSLDFIADDRHCFYDLDADPHQMRNLAKTDEQADIAQSLRQRLTDWHASTPWLDQVQRQQKNPIARANAE